MKRTLLGAAFAAALAFNPARPALAQVPTGSAGSPNASVVTVQGISGGTGLHATAAQGAASTAPNAWPTYPVISGLAVSSSHGLPIVPATGATFTLGGSLPGYASTPTFNLGTLNGAATATNQTNVQSAVGSSATTAITIQGSSSGVAIPISGTVTANAGTNMSTAALALESGGNLAAIKTNTAVTAAGASASSGLPIQGMTGGVAVPVSAASLPLPSGAATAANQANTQGSPTGGTAASNSDLVGGIYHTSLPTLTNGQQAGLQLDASGRVIVNCGSGCSVGSVANVTPTDCSGSIATAGTAQNAITAQTTLHGFTIKNTDASAGGGEPIWISFTTTAAANTAGSYPLGPPVTTSFAGGESFSTPPGFGTNHAVSVIAATTGHKFSCTWW